MNFLSIRMFIVRAFVFLGPLGNLLTPHFFPTQFRFYYFLLPFFPLFYTRFSLKEAKTLLLFFPFLYYSLLSSLYTEFFGMAKEPYPLFRFALFASQFLFVLGAALLFRNKELAAHKNDLIRIYLKGFFLSLIVGYLLYIGYYAHWFSYSDINRFSVLSQIGYGFLRFSPGSYPNEYGNLSSFVLSIITLLILERKKLFRHRCFLYLFFILTFVACFLTTTRAAFFSYIITLIYLFGISYKFRRSFIRFLILSLLLLTTIHLTSIPIYSIIMSGIKAMSLGLGSFGVRMEAWSLSLQEFYKTPLFGSGFASLSNTHNVYLQLLFELGVIGSTLLLITLFLFVTKQMYKLRDLCFKRHMSESGLFSNRVIVIGCIHLFWFALSNHNINHHQTWFVFLLLFMNLFERVQNRLPSKLALVKKIDDF